MKQQVFENPFTIVPLPPFLGLVKLSNTAYFHRAIAKGPSPCQHRSLRKLTKTVTTFTPIAYFREFQEGLWRSRGNAFLKHLAVLNY